MQIIINTGAQAVDRGMGQRAWEILKKGFGGQKDDFTNGFHGEGKDISPRWDSRTFGKSGHRAREFAPLHIHICVRVRVYTPLLYI